MAGGPARAALLGAMLALAATPLSAQPAPTARSLGIPAQPPKFSDNFQVYCWAWPIIDRVNAAYDGQSRVDFIMTLDKETRRLLRVAAMTTSSWYNNPQAEAETRRGRRCAWERAVTAPAVSQPVTTAPPVSPAPAAHAPPPKPRYFIRHSHVGAQVGVLGYVQSTSTHEVWTEPDPAGHLQRIGHACRFELYANAYALPKSLKVGTVIRTDDYGRRKSVGPAGELINEAGEVLCYDLQLSNLESYSYRRN